MASDLQHSKLFPPSSSKRWIQCAASAVICAYGARVPEQPHPNTLRGTLMHGVSEDVLAGLIPDCKAAIGRKLLDQKFDVIAAKEAQGYVDYVHKYMEQDPDAVLYIEQRLYFSVLIGADPGEAFGSGDAIVILPNLKRMAVIDLKTGKHLVEAEGNKQCLFYGAGALNWFRMFYDIDEIDIVIYQRRASSWMVTPEYLNKFIISVRPGVKRIKQCEEIYLRTKQIPLSFYRPSPAACEWCPVLKCPHKQGEAYKK